MRWSVFIDYLSSARVMEQYCTMYKAILGVGDTFSNAKDFFQRVCFIMDFFILLDTPSGSCCQRKEHRTTHVKPLRFIHCCTLSYSSSCILWRHWLLKKILVLVLAWKSNHKVPFLPLGYSCPLQTILLSDLFRCDSRLQIVMAFWHTIIVSNGLSHPTQKVWIQMKGHQTAITIRWRCHTRLDVPSDDISGRFFQGWRNPLMI